MPTTLLVNAHLNYGHTVLQACLEICVWAPNSMVLQDQAPNGALMPFSDTCLAALGNVLHDFLPR